MDRQQLKLSVRISRELPFINTDEIQMFLDEHYWIEEKYNKEQKFDVETIYDDLIEFLESKKERYSSLKQIISEGKKQQNTELDKYVSFEFKEYNFLKKIDELRASIKNKEQLQKHLQFILISLDKIIESVSVSNSSIIVDVDKFTMSQADNVIQILGFFGYRLASIQNIGFTTLECTEPDAQFTLNSIIHMNENLKEELFFDEIQIQKEQDRQKVIEQKIKTINAHRHKTNLYDFQKRQDLSSQSQSAQQKNEIKQRVQEQIKVQIHKSQNPFLQGQGYSLNDVVQQQSQQNQQANNMTQPSPQVNNIKIFEEFERLSEKDIMKHVNLYRQSLGLNELKWSDQIAVVCRNHSVNMGQQKISFGHENFSERRTQIYQNYKNLQLSCENVFQYYTYLGIAKNALDLWKNTSGNDTNLKSDSNYCGVGAYRQYPIQKKDNDYNQTFIEQK